MLGRLSSIGYQQHIVNGQGLAKRYIDTYGLLPSNFTSTDDISQTVVLRADDSDRTQHSAMALFTGSLSPFSRFSTPTRAKKEKKKPEKKREKAQRECTVQYSATPLFNSQTQDSTKTTKETSESLSKPKIKTRT